MLTAEEFARLPDLGPCELVNGKIVRLTHTRPTHGIVEIRMGASLLAWADKTGRGLVMGGEVGLWVRRNPDTVRGADVLFISHERYARRDPKGVLDVAPELVVEILSPDDRRGHVEEKLAEYLEMGVDLVWIVDPEFRYVLAYRSQFDVERFEKGDVLTDEEILPGFFLSVSDLFRD
ncbi:MAG TPA: Uma2 family endonuclease [Thermoanaerobaculia bacterium]